MWVDYFNYEYCIFADTLFIRGLDERDRRRPAFAVPVGAMPLPEALEVLRAYCRAEGCDMLLSAVPQDVVADLLEAGARSVELLECWGDYLYGAHDLASLEGKHFNKKRNHVNRFVQDNPGWVLEDIGAANLGEAAAFLESLPIVEKADDAEALYERQQCARVLEFWNCFGFEGAVLRDAPAGRIVALTAAEVIGDTAIIHIEKMDHTVAGAGESVNKFFAMHLLESHPGLKYLNREDDAGDEGLRRAKESYHPLRILHKYNVMFSKM